MTCSWQEMGECTILIDLLDLSAAYDAVIHDILIQGVKEFCAINGLVLQWPQRVSHGLSFSSSIYPIWNKKYYKVWVQILFVVYMQLGKIAECHGLVYLIITVLYPRVNDQSPVIKSFLAKLQEQIKAKWLKLNQDKTKVLLVGGQNVIEKWQPKHPTPLSLGNTTL